MGFSIGKTIEILQSTPGTLTNMTGGHSAFWTNQNEGGETWSVFDVIGHLIHGEKTDWIIRTKVILSDNQDKNFEPFDRWAQQQNSAGKTLHQLLAEFAALRRENIHILRGLNITENDLLKTGFHPSFGQVNLQQLLATWAVHDLNHISQIARIMAKQYKVETGPWIQFLKILNQ